MPAGNLQPAAQARPELLDVALELGFLTHAQVADFLLHEKHWRRGRIHVPVSQALLELKLLNVAQLRTLNDELEMRSKRRALPGAQPHAVPLLGKFKVLKILHENGYTRVYRALDTLHDRVVVLKVLPRGMSKQSQWYERFQREMNLVGGLSHPNIVDVYECGTLDESPYISFEFVDGPSLALRLEREGNIAEQPALLICREAAKALAHIEASGILHRDMKPENVLCGLNGRVKIIDLGLSKSLLDGCMITAVGETVGTPFYMSPEQATGTHGLDHRTDIYALGCTTYHMLTGSVPFFAEDATEVMLRHVQAPRPNPREIVPEITQGGASLVTWMMATHPEERPDSAKRVVAAIDALLPGIPDPPPTSRSVLRIVPS